MISQTSPAMNVWVACGIFQTLALLAMPRNAEAETPIPAKGVPLAKAESRAMGGGGTPAFRQVDSDGVTWMNPIYGTPPYGNGIADDWLLEDDTPRGLVRYTFTVCDNSNVSCGSEDTFDVRSALYAADPTGGGSICELAPEDEPILGTECEFLGLQASKDGTVMCQELECKVSGPVLLPDFVWMGVTSDPIAIDCDSNGSAETGAHLLFDSDAIGPETTELGFSENILSVGPCSFLLICTTPGPGTAPPWEDCFAIGFFPGEVSNVMGTLYTGPGACCRANGICENDDENRCTSSGGTYAGDGTDCSDQSDGDSHSDPCDNCPMNSNPGQEDADGDGEGDACDACTDTDGDGFGNPGFSANTCPPDNCPTISNLGQDDLGDEDGVGDDCDNCTFIPNTGQDDGDLDDVGDACDNCPCDPNLDQSNSDTDASGDACDADADNDGVLNEVDPCPFVANQNIPCPTENCHNGVDDDNDRLSDCADSDCAQDANCACDCNCLPDPVIICTADIDGDEELDTQDATLMSACFDSDCVAVATPEPECDVNCDGTVSCRDYLDFLCSRNGGTDCCQRGPLGACCAPTGFGAFSGLRCIELPEEHCMTLVSGGTYFGDGTRCESITCDCNDNGLSDAVEMTMEPGRDCDGNGLLDVCAPARRIYGDVHPPVCPSSPFECDPFNTGDGDIDVDDILVEIGAFIGELTPAEHGDVHPCNADCNHGDGDTDVDDILAVLSAFSGFLPEGCPCVCSNCP